MIADLLAAWPLFAQSWITAWLVAPLLALIGIALVARGAIFQGVATAQASTAAVATMLVTAQAVSWVGEPWAVSAAAMLVAVIASVVAFSGRSSEATNGWLFLTAGAATPLLLVHSSHGLAEVQHLVTSSLIGATWADAGFFAVLLIVLVMALVRYGPSLRMVLLDPGFAAEVGIRVSRWHFLIGLMTGIAIGSALRVAGLLFVAGCLVLPALAARRWVPTTRAVAILAPVVALGGTLLGTVVAHLGDLPLGQVVVAVLSLTVLLAHLLPRSD
jgi:zinc transport system permease protein